MPLLLLLLVLAVGIPVGVAVAVDDAVVVDVAVGVDVAASNRILHGDPCGGPTGVPMGFLRDSHGDTTGCSWHSHGPPWNNTNIGLGLNIRIPWACGSPQNNTNIGLGLSIRIPWVCGSPPPE